MQQAIRTTQRAIAHLVTALTGPQASAKSRRQARIFLGVLALVCANVWLGAWIGHGNAAILGVMAFFAITRFYGDPA